MKNFSKTIFGPASAIDDSGISVIRISGDDTFQVLSKIFSKSQNEFTPLDFNSVSSHTLHHGYLFNDKELIDEIILSIYKSPNSFTGEALAEISSHGGWFIFRKISSLLVSRGLFPSEPGEFSKRAYLNGKMDLAQAEAVADLIRAKTESSNKIALQQLSGEFSKEMNSLKDDLINYCSLLELELDFSEEGLELVSQAQLLEKIDKILEKFRKITTTFESGRIIKEGINLAIIGKPNVGKSSVFNYLLNQNRAIVSDIPGTTRDYLQESLIMGGFLFNVIDTAGIRDTKDLIEIEGVKRSHQKMNESDIILEIEDASNHINEVDRGNAKKSKFLTIFNKSDLMNSISKNGNFYISAKTGENMKELQVKIVNKAKNLIKSDINSEIIITNVRHKNCLLKSCEYLVNAKNQILSNRGNELISFEIRGAIKSIAEITGKVTNVDILNNIFSKFCIGK